MYIESKVVMESVQKEIDLQNELYGNPNVRINSEERWGDILEHTIRAFWGAMLLDLDPESARVFILELVATGIIFLQQYGVVEKAEYYREEKAVE
jgi:dsRNA-specific ribonuclease